MKIINEKEAVSYIKNGDTVAISGFGGGGSPEAILHAIHDTFLEEGKPSNLTVTCGISPGNLTEDPVGMNLLTPEGLIKKAICAHLGMGKAFGKAVGRNQFPAFAVPLGVMNHLYRAIAGKEVGVLTHIGLDTFADPRIDGCCANEKAKEEEPIVELISVSGKENLLYKSFPIDVAIIKGTYADEEGNISVEHETLIGEQYNMAVASHNSGGLVIAQVEKIVPYGSLRARDVIVHSSFIDYVVVAEPDLTLGDYNSPVYKPEVVGDKRIELEKIAVRPLDERKICGRRSALELKKGDVINLGVGMPDAVASVSAEEGISNQIYLSVESGPTGGVPIGGVAFGGAINPDSVLPTAEQFDAYNGGSLDMAILGLAEVDESGNVNVSKFGPRITGPGGFINITQCTKKVIFMGTFTNSGLEEEIIDGKLHIIKEGTKRKFVSNVEQITFSGKNAIKNDQQILYITERAVFELTKDGLKLIEIAPGIDIKKDILDQMDFMPVFGNEIHYMNPKIFQDEKMNLQI